MDDGVEKYWRNKLQNDVLMLSQKLSEIYSAVISLQKRIERLEYKGMHND